VVELRPDPRGALERHAFRERRRPRTSLRGFRVVV